MFSYLNPFSYSPISYLYSWFGSKQEDPKEMLHKQLETLEKRCVFIQKKIEIEKNETIELLKKGSKQGKIFKNLF